MPRSRASAKQAGSAFESLIAKAFAWHLRDERIERRVTNGAKDRGDIANVYTSHGQRLVIECKDVATMNLAGWVTEAHYEAINDNAVAGIVVHKRRGTANPLDQYVTMTLGDLLRLGWGIDPNGAHNE